MAEKGTIVTVDGIRGAAKGDNSKTGLWGAVGKLRWYNVNLRKFTTQSKLDLLRKAMEAETDKGLVEMVLDNELSAYFLGFIAAAQVSQDSRRTKKTKIVDLLNLLDETLMVEETDARL